MAGATAPPHLRAMRPRRVPRCRVREAVREPSCVRGRHPSECLAYSKADGAVDAEPAGLWRSALRALVLSDHLQSGGCDCGVQPQGSDDGAIAQAESEAGL